MQTAQAFLAEGPLGATDGRDQGVYPPLLMESPRRWVRRDAPTWPEISRLVAELRRHLGRDGFTWVAACAAYPELRWKLMLYLGGVLLGERARGDLLASLLRLPWFRSGSMPNWLRLGLVRALPPKQLVAVRQALQHLLLEASEARGAFQLQVSTPRLRGWWKPKFLISFLRTEPRDSRLRDHVLISVLEGKPPELAIEAPRGARRFFARLAGERKPVLQGAFAVLLGAAGL